MRGRLQTGLTITAVLGLFAIVIDASDNYTVNHGANLAITAHSTCGMVTNNSATGRSVYVPTQSSLEWQSFRANPPAGVTLSSCVTPGSQTYSTPGTYTFTVPNYNTLTVELWGGGGGGAGSVGNAGGDGAAGGTGGQSYWGSTAVRATGGQGAAPGFPTNYTAVGGTGSGCTTNGTGGSGGVLQHRQNNGYVTSGEGGDGASGGGGGASVGGGQADVNGRPGTAPGGGGSGAHRYHAMKGSTVSTGYPGGGGGGYCRRVYSAGTYSPGSGVTVVVGAGGAGGDWNVDGGAGASGRVRITWE